MRDSFFDIAGSEEVDPTFVNLVLLVLTFRNLGFLFPFLLKI